MYELWLLLEHPENDVNNREKLSNVLQDVNGKLSGSKLCGAFQSEFGNSNSTIVIWQHESFDDTKSLRQEWKSKGMLLYLSFNKIGILKYKIIFRVCVYCYLICSNIN